MLNEHLREVEIGHVAKLRSGYSFKSVDWISTGVPVIKIATIKGGRVVLDGCGYVEDEVAASASDWFAQSGDVLIAMTGYVGEVAWVRESEAFLINQRVGRFGFLNADVDPKSFVGKIICQHTKCVRITSGTWWTLGSYSASVASSSMANIGLLTLATPRIGCSSVPHSSLKTRVQFRTRSGPVTGASLIHRDVQVPRTHERWRRQSKRFSGCGATATKQAARHAGPRAPLADTRTSCETDLKYGSLASSKPPGAFRSS